MGSGGPLRSDRTWWLHPVPDDDHLDVVVAWEEQGVPETATRLDLRPLREAATREEILWDPPPTLGSAGGGWFGYAGPMPGAAYGSSLRITWDDEQDAPGPDEAE